MARTSALVVGALLVLAGILGFLASSVALATASKVPDIKTPKGVELTLPPDNPDVVERQRQAESVLFGSLLCGGCGVVIIGIGLWLGKKAKQRPAPQSSSPKNQSSFTAADRPGNAATTSNDEQRPAIQNDEVP